MLRSFYLKSSLSQRLIHQKAAELYVKEHLSNKIFTRSCQYRNIDSCRRRMYALLVGYEYSYVFS